MRTLATMERPLSRILRPQRAAASATCCTRWMLLEKAATMMRPAQVGKISSKASPTDFSERVKPSRSTLVESDSSASTPCSP